MSTPDQQAALVNLVEATDSLTAKGQDGAYTLSSADAVAANDATPLTYRSVDIADVAALMDRTGITVACQIARQTLPASGDTLDTLKAATAAVSILNRPYRLRMDQPENRGPVLWAFGVLTAAGVVDDTQAEQLAALWEARDYPLGRPGVTADELDAARVAVRQKRAVIDGYNAAIDAAGTGLSDEQLKNLLTGGFN